MADLQPVYMTAGDSRVLKFGPVSDLQGNWTDLSGSPTAIWRLSRSPYSMGSDILLTKTDHSGITFESESFYGALRWYVVVTLVPSDTHGLPPCISPNIWYHQLRVSDSAGNTSTVARGPFNLLPSPDDQQ